MKSIQQPNIRRIYYIGNLAVFAMLSLTLIILILPNLRNEYRRKVKQLYTGIVNQEKQRMQAIVWNEILNIEERRENLLNEYTVIAEYMSKTIALLLESQYGDAEELLAAAVSSHDLFSEFSQGELSYRLIDGNTGKAIAAPQEQRGVGDQPETFPPSFSSRAFNRIEVVVFLSQDKFNRILQDRVIEHIRNVELPGDGYIWINHILDYSGGDNYAARLVHPNLPETEGMLLSTNNQDLEGNFPYKAELDGINAEGEVFLEYYFKKLSSDEVILKLSYAKLYKEFDWVIATGTYMDDVGMLVQREQAAMEKSFNKEIRAIFLAILIIMIVLILVLLSFERWINDFILSHTKELRDKNKELSIEKDKVEHAFRKIEEVAFLDPLTDLWNRRAMYDCLLKEAARSIRMKEHFCIIMADVDYFKKINDSYGHNAGDFVLKELAVLLKDHLRSEDRIARWGGEEFLLLATASGITEGRFVAEKLRKGVEGRRFFFEERELRLTMTFGVSEFSGSAALDQVINSADSKLYRGKRMGRNCVVHDEPEKPEP